MGYDDNISDTHLYTHLYLNHDQHALLYSAQDA